jgi:hypothetical protein
MENTLLTKQQQLSLEILNDNILNPDILLQHCPLDYGRHTLNPKNDLGNFQQLPTELQHQVLRELDIQVSSHLSTREPECHGHGQQHRGVPEGKARTLKSLTHSK